MHEINLLPVLHYTFPLKDDKLIPESTDFTSHQFHPFQQMMNGIDTLHIDGQVIIHTAVSFHIGKLRRKQIVLAALGAYLNQATFL